MALNIKNEETCSLARELAELTGETMTGAITVALRERLERERHERSVEARHRGDPRHLAACREQPRPGPPLRWSTATGSTTSTAFRSDHRLLSAAVTSTSFMRCRLQSASPGCMVDIAHAVLPWGFR